MKLMVGSYKMVIFFYKIWICGSNFVFKNVKSWYEILKSSLFGEFKISISWIQIMRWNLMFKCWFYLMILNLEVKLHVQLNITTLIQGICFISMTWLVEFFKANIYKILLCSHSRYDQLWVCFPFHFNQDKDKFRFSGLSRWEILYFGWVIWPSIHRFFWIE